MQVSINLSVKRIRYPEKPERRTKQLLSSSTFCIITYNCDISIM